MVLTVVLEKTLESPLDCKEIKQVNPKGNQFWVFIGRTDAEAQAPTLATWCKELTHWKGPWRLARLKTGGEGNDREWDGWMTSPTWCTWVWASSRSWWWVVKPGVLQSMGSQRVRHNWVTELNWYVESKISHKWTCLRNRNRLRDIENKLMVTKGGRW